MTSEEIKATIERLKAIPCDDTPAVYSVAGAFMDMDMNGSYSAVGLRNRLIGLLEQADPDNYTLVDADMVPIHEGDTVYSTTNCKKLVVKNIYACVNCAYITLTANGECIEEVGYVNHMPNMLTHRKPTVEDVLNRFYIDCEDAGGSSSAVKQLAAEYADRLREVMRDE